MIDALGEVLPLLKSGVKLHLGKIADGYVVLQEEADRVRVGLVFSRYSLWLRVHCFGRGSY